jgi:hypothetical protein
MSGLVCGRKLFLFAALSLADLALTSLLLQRAEGRAWESNPIAAWWLNRFGWPGLAGFKLATVLVVLSLVLVVSRHRPRSGERLLGFGCSTLLAVVLYSGFLVYGLEAEAGAGEAAEFRQARESIQDLEWYAVRLRAYYALLGRLAGDLVEHRRTLAGTVEALAEAEYVKDPRWLPRMQGRFPNCTKDECLARQLVVYTLISVQADPYRAEQVHRDLDAQFRTHFGRPAPYRPGRPGQEPVEEVRGEPLAPGVVQHFRHGWGGFRSQDERALAL